jgi:Zn-dependent protease
VGFQDRRYDERGQGDPGFWRRVLGEGDNFFNWGVPLFRVFGITVRLHMLFLLVIVARLLNSMRPDQIGPGQTAIMLLCLFTMVLLHEFGHCFACRRVGGEADDIVLWPLGGLAMCRPPNDWKAHLITTLGGPAVNLALAPILGAAVYAVTRNWDAVFFNPLNSTRGAVAAWDAGQLGAWLFWAHAANIYMFLFNMCLPMYPMDCGRIVQELLWPRVGRDKSLHIATSLGLFMAVGVGVFALMMNLMSLFGVALFAGFTCWQQKQNLRFMAASGMSDGPEFPTAYQQKDTAKERSKYAAALKEQQRRQAEEAEVDRILAKISQQGMDSLTRSERKALERHTQRRRSGQG